MLPPGNRAGRMLTLIEQRKFFMLRAGRQVGKTTTAQWLAHHLHDEGRFATIYWDVQTAREISDTSHAMRVLLARLEQARAYDLPEAAGLDLDALLQVPETCVLLALRQMTAAATLPLVVIVDEADSLVGTAMVSFLTQLRDGYIERERVPFASSVVLIGQREIRDFALSREEQKNVTWLSTASPFNITAESLTIGPFTHDEVARLLAQHTDETAQVFEDEATEHIWYLSQGHPWLVNALAAEAVEREAPHPKIAVTRTHVEAGKERIIHERRSHIDSLTSKLREERVKRILSPMLAGNAIDGDGLDDDFAYVAALGLVSQIDGRWQPANPIYREVIVRALTYLRQTQILHETAWYVNPDGSLNLEKSFRAFQEFWRIDGHLAVEGFNYREAGPHLTLMAFLQRVVNGGGQILREYALGRGALDLLVEWHGTRHAIEVKLRRDTETETDAYRQIERYLEHLELNEGWLVLFDLRSTAPWSERLFLKDVEVAGKRVRVVGA